nr:hypothetical protein [uncultured Flavobacterium sp.]
MNKLLTFLLFLSVSAFAQRQNFSGRVIIGEATLPNVFVINQATAEETKTDATGLFTIPVKSGDVLAIYSDRTETREFEIKRKWFNEQPFTFEVKPRATELNEVVVEDSKINSKKLGVTTGNEKELTTAQNRKRANRALRTNQGLNISGDAIANKINGRTKIINDNLKTEDRIIAMDNFKVMYSNDEITDAYGIPADQIEAFAYYIVEDPDCLQALRANSRAQAKPHLQRLAKQFLERKDDEK